MGQTLIHDGLDARRMLDMPTPPAWTDDETWNFRSDAAQKAILAHAMSEGMANRPSTAAALAEEEEEGAPLASGTPKPGGKLFGLREWEVAAGQEAKATKTIQQLEADYVKATGRKPVVLDSDHPQGALGYINPENGRIELYSGERFGSAPRAEELFHWQQLKDRGLLGKTEAEIGPKVIHEIEQEVEGMLRNAGFQPRR